MAKPLILVVDDEQHILELLDFNLTAAGFATALALDGERALAIANADHPSLILLDLMLPGIDGSEVCRRLKALPTTADIPIIMLSARSEDVDKIVALEMGADDYVTKPFSVPELMARIKALLRRSSQSAEPTLIQVGNLSVNTETYEARRNGEPLRLTLKEFELLKLLAQSNGRVQTRDFILDRVWGYEFYGETRTVDVHIRHLRMKLGEDADYIQTIRGVGYRLQAPRTRDALPSAT